jgi:hypothetical protein
MRSIASLLVEAPLEDLAQAVVRSPKSGILRRVHGRLSRRRAMSKPSPLRWLAVAWFAGLGALTYGCGSEHGATAPAAGGTVALPPAGTSTDNLRATAIAWSNAFLVGSLADIKALEGPECAPQSNTTVAARTATVYLRGMRTEMRAHLGPLDRIKILGVDVRNVTDTSGEALVEYDLPAAVVGNDNWVSYAVHDGRWKVADCHAPIGGSSSSATSASTAMP